MSPQSILIVKTSSLGDIVQSFDVLPYLHQKFPGVQIDWVVEASLASLVSAHPLVHQAIPLDVQGLKKSWNLAKFWRDLKDLRNKKYDLLFDLQKNTKSGIITAFARSPMKVGFGRKSVREWPNLLATHRKFEVSAVQNVRLQYVGLIKQFLSEERGPMMVGGVCFKIAASEQDRIATILRAKELSAKYKIMVCPGSRWPNKQLPLETMVGFLKKIEERLEVSFLFMWGDAGEKRTCEKMQQQFSQNSLVIDKLKIPVWQNLMNAMGLVIAIDSSALHLCGTTKAPSFSLFGPTAPEIFKPIGERHCAIQGACPYGQKFAKQCPKLRTCPTGTCIRGLKVDEIFDKFWDWWKQI